MKISLYKIAIFLFLIHAPVVIFSQQFNRPDNLPDQKSIYKNFCWFRERVNRMDGEKRWKYYLTGREYEIGIDYTITKDFLFSTQKGLIKLISMDYEKKSDRVEKDRSDFPLPNKTIYSRKMKDSITTSQIIYCLPDLSDTGAYKISMTTFENRDTVLEKNIILSILYDRITDSLFLSPGPNMIDFAGRLITIKEYFRWMAPNNIFCPEFGEMNWSLHETTRQAYVSMNLQLEKNNNSKIVEIIKTDTIDITFEETKQKALRVTYKAKTPKILWGKASRILIVYYIVAPVRGQYIHCVLSHYDDQLINSNVPPPLSYVMSLE